MGDSWNTVNTVKCTLWEMGQVKSGLRVRVGSETTFPIMPCSTSCTSMHRHSGMVKITVWHLLSFELKVLKSALTHFSVRPVTRCKMFVKGHSNGSGVRQTLGGGSKGWGCCRRISGEGLGHGWGQKTHENLSCSRISSYFDPSVGSDWASLMSICLPGISLAPGNPTGFLRVDGIRMVLD